MEAAGATIIEKTGDDAVMGMPGLAKIREHQRINARIEEWLSRNQVAVHVPVDSPAANFPICELTKRSGAKVVHLVAPQIWAWGRWRIHKLRRLTDLVLCLLPFEQAFFSRRGVPAKFIGHMLFDEKPDEEELDRRARAFSGPDEQNSPRIAFMPGSRPDELKRNFPVMLDAFRSLHRDYPSARGVVAATGDPVASYLRKVAEERGGWPKELKIAVQETDAVIRWCELAIVKSGTVTLQVARQLRPMVIFYKKSNPLLFMIARAVLSTKMFALPNVIAGRRIVPELIPHFGGPGAIARLAKELIERPDAALEQRRELAALVAQFNDHHASSSAADAIAEMAGLEPRGIPKAMMD